MDRWIDRWVGRNVSLVGWLVVSWVGE